MCRMLAIHGPDVRVAQEVLRGFQHQARDSRAGPDSPERHPDGWGLVTARPGDVRYVVRRTNDAGADPVYLKTLEVLAHMPAPSLFLAHFRQASKGTVRLENTHPFVAEGWAFAHNGTVHGDLGAPGVRYAGDTDSERLFFKLREHLRSEPDPETAIRNFVSELDEHNTYSSLTFLITNGTTLYGYRRVGSAIDDCGTRECALEAYGLGVGRVGAATIVCQERTHLPAMESWEEVPDDGLLVLDLSPRPTLVSPTGPSRTPASGPSSIRA